MDNNEQTNTENSTKQRTEVVKIDGVSPQINLSPGSETHKRFARIKTENGIVTNREVVDFLMSVYETPTYNADDQATITALENKLATQKELNDGIAKEAAAIRKENYELKEKLEAATNTANENAAKAQSIELSTQGAIIIKPNPVVAYFLEEMAAKTGKTPADILQALYIDDLQNPRSNNLPYTVSSSRIREVMEELKQQKNG